MKKSDLTLIFSKELDPESSKAQAMESEAISQIQSLRLGDNPEHSPEPS